MLQLLKNKAFIVLTLLFILGVGLRWYKLSDNLFFGFEQGRDFLIAEKISQLSDFVLVGPKTDIDGVFHGAHYYYLLAALFFITGGNPLTVSFILIVFSTLSIIPLYAFVKKVTKSQTAGFLASFIFVISYHYMQYARWLSNVSPAVPLGALAFYCIYMFSQNKKPQYFIAHIFFAFFAAQFEIILVLWFVFFLGLLFVTKTIPLPNFKTLAISASVVFFLFLPFLLFNMRNEWITLHSVGKYLSEGSGESTPIASRLGKYVFLQTEQVQEHLLRLPQFSILVMLLAAVIFIYTKRKIFSSSEISGLKISLAWFFMTLPVLLFPKSLSLVQLYILSGLGLLVGASIVFHKLWTIKKGKIIVGLLALLFVLNFSNNFQLLSENKKVFFTTIQDGHNLKDQRALLEYIQQDSNNEPYHFKSLVIPYYQEEGWQYLHSYYVGTKTGIEYKTVYLIIEKPVDPMWRERWTSELGPTELNESKQFGYFTLEKRSKIENNK